MGGDYQPAGAPLTGKKVALIFATFIATFVTVDISMWKMAASSFRGLVSQEAFREGVKYDVQIAEAKAQEQRGWKVEAHVDPLRDGVARVTLRVKDANGRDLVGLRSSVVFSHPTDIKRDVSVEMKETGLGIYVGEAALTPGSYHLLTELFEGERRMFQSRNRLQVGG
jgi:nitrogen fixation protein FixH